MSWDKVGKDVESGPRGLFKWVAIFVVSATLLFGGINLFMKPAAMAVDRMVMKQSFQYKEGMEQRAATLQASITEADILISQEQDSEVRSRLSAQKRILQAQLRAVTINQ